MQHLSKDVLQEHSVGASLPSVMLASGRYATGSASVEPFTTSRLATVAKAILEERRRRRLFFKATLFSDPAWDLLLALLAAEGDGKRHTISSVGIPGGVPVTTAMRWIKTLVHQGLVVREDDPLDARRSFLSLTGFGLGALQRYFETSSLPEIL